MIKRFKIIAACVLSAAMLFQILIITAFAADCTLNLSTSSGYAGDSITISGNCDPNEWITVKAGDSDGNIVYIKPVLSANDGKYSTGLIVPDIDAGMLTIIAGSGSNVANIDFTVKKTSSHEGDGNDDSAVNNEESSKEIEIVNSGGETISGTIEETEDGYDITIGGDDFSKITGGSVKIAAPYVEVTFDETAAEYISKQAGSGNVVLSIINAGVSGLSDEAQALIGDSPAYEFILNAGGSDLSSFGGGLAYVSIPYTLADDEEIKRIVIYYISDAGGLMVMTDSIYDGASKNVKFSTGHFSVYAVGYNDISFDDVSNSNWFYDAVTFCAAREITSGTGNNMFSPDMTLTRGQFITLLMRAYDIEADGDISGNFADAGHAYYTEYLAAAKRLGITKGLGNNMFAPEDEITRQDMFTLLYRALDVLEELPEADTSSSLSDFSDTDEISDYADDAMKTLVAAGIISGSDGKLMPMGNSTRAQMAQVIYNLLSSSYADLKH